MNNYRWCLFTAISCCLAETKADAPSIESTSSGGVAITASDVSFMLDGAAAVTMSSLIARLKNVENQLSDAQSENTRLKGRVAVLENNAVSPDDDNGSNDDSKDAIQKLSERVNALEKEDPIGYTDGKLTELTATINAVNTSLASSMEMYWHVASYNPTMVSITITHATLSAIQRTFTAQSFGHCSGADDPDNEKGGAEFTVNGDRISPDSSEKKASSRGIHVVAFNPDKDHAKMWYNVYDTCCSKTLAPSDESERLVEDIAKLPEGTVVLAAIADDGVRGITADAINTLVSLGSQYIRTIASRESWAIIGRKGAVKGSAPEDHGKAHSAEPSTCQDKAGNAPDFAQRPTRTLSETFYTGGLGKQVTEALQLHTDLAAWHRGEQRIDAVEIAVQSVSGCARYDNPDAVFGVGWRIDGIQPRRPTRPRRGFNFITLQPMTLQLGCDIEGLGCPTFDTYANTDNATGEMYDWINNLPMGTVVAGGIVDEGTNGMTVLGHSALDMLGCSLSRSIKFREGYAFIGTKGDTQGAAVEDHGTATYDASDGAISANEKKCTDNSNSGNEYNPRPTRQLRRVYFKGQAGLPIDQEFGRRAGAFAVEDSVKMLSRGASRNFATIDVTSFGACIGPSNKAEIMVDGIRIDPQRFVNRNGFHNRGIFAAAFAEKGNELIWAVFYDTYAHAQARTDLNDALTKLAPGTYLAAAISDAHQTNDALSATMTQSFGSKYFADLKHRESWAFVSQKDPTGDDDADGFNGHVLFEQDGGGRGNGGTPSARDKDCTANDGDSGYKPLIAEGSAILVGKDMKGILSGWW